MTKIPVGKTIAYAYAFTFGNFLTVLGLSWVPLAIMAAGAFLVVPVYFQGLQLMAANRDPSQLFTGFGSMALFGILAFACFVMMYVALARQALGLRTGPAYFYFSLDSAFWHLLAAYFLTFLLIMGGFLVVGIVAGVLGVLLAPLVALVILIALIGTFYVLLRLMFLQPAVAVAETNRIITRSWSLAKGNVWRIFVVLVGVIVPLVILQTIVQAAFFSSLAIPPPPEDDPAAAIAFMAQLGAQVIALLPILIPVILLFYAAYTALIIGASAFAYRSLVPAAEGTAAEFA